MSSSFKEQVAVVTGAGQGIGYAICQKLTQEGAAVMLNDIDPVLAEETAGKIRAEGGRCSALAGDVADPAFNASLVAAAVEQFGRLDLVVANAGITLFQDFFEVTPQDFQRLIQTNLGGCFFLAQAAGLQYRKQGTGGSMVFMSSVTGTQAWQGLSVYSSSKAAIQMLARHLVVDFSPLGVNVNAVAPGATLTERTALDPGYEQNWSLVTPMAKPAYPQDIAEAVCFLLSSAGRHITGQTLTVDGGWTALSPPCASR